MEVRGARVHNLKNIDLDIPKNQLVVFTGLSGSGKSSLAFDTIYAEGQRRYVESLSSYARQFLGMMEKPDVDQIDGLNPAISIDQKTVSHNPRSTVGTTTEIYDYLRLLFARIGHPHCPNCGREISAQTPQQIVDAIINQFKPATKNASDARVLILAPLVKDRKGEYGALLDDLARRGYTRVRIDGKIFDTDDNKITLIKTNKHTIEAVVDRMVIDEKTDRTRVSNSVEKALKLSNGTVIVSEILDKSLDFPKDPKDFQDHLFSERFACPDCNISLPELEPRSFSFNSPHGACPVCDGIGTRLEVDPALIMNGELTIEEGGFFPWAQAVMHDSHARRYLLRMGEKYDFGLDTKIKDLPQAAMDEIVGNGLAPTIERRYKETQSESARDYYRKFMNETICTECNGTRLKPEVLSVDVGGLNIAEVTALSIDELEEWLSGLDSSMVKMVDDKANKFARGYLTERESQIAKPILRELTSRVQFLLDVGLNYLSLSRTSGTLSGGESQRIRLASQIGSGLSGVLYVLDEPSIGLHPRDHSKLLTTLTHLRDLGNTVIIVEHDQETMEKSDWIIDFGPGAGVHGGQITAQGTPDEIAKDKNSVTGHYLSGKKVVYPHANKRTPDFEKALKLIGATEHNLKDITVEFPLGAFTCVTGVSGSGKSTLVLETLYKRLALEKSRSKVTPAPHKGMEGLELVDKVIEINQSPIGRTPRSNPATYTGVFTPIRELFASLPESKARGYKQGRFSFNVKGGRCESCQGEGQNRIEMQFLADVYVTCDVCGGSRFNRETLDIKFKDRSIAEILDMTVEEALDFFASVPSINSKIETLMEVGLGYMKLGQPAPTLSGGEAQRVKLATELSKRSTGKTVYILDEPTTGLHFADIDKLLHVLHKLVDEGNTVIVIEHNLDVIKTADWIVDLGPEGGDAGGKVVFTGTVDEIVKDEYSYTGEYLKRLKG
ncbi:excinuclease ABC subunit UvrA [candidate division WWE3 bacterium]|uniref:UvrABC system protein A n=1 Tax=candidate division WWE3 bacterium TaxID=2053526 RepID=A0A955LKB7_UNCKA|nr:excinuclease ABC subunit UvrA [candidate division WWE3 bacterium]